MKTKNKHCIRLATPLGIQNSMTKVLSLIDRAMLDVSIDVHTDSWQGLDIKARPEARMKELLNVSFTLNTLGMDTDTLLDEVGANRPWADDHFLERVCGEPINPGTEWANWPWGGSASKFLNAAGQFNHNYMERYWPKVAGLSVHASASAAQFKAGHDSFKDIFADKPPAYAPHFGIRHSYGDLNDVVSLLVKDPQTRQAWLPIFFPEDTGVGDGLRKPCTLGYQFMVRDDELHIYYPLRSCDYAKHFRDDIHLTLLLGLWVIEQASKQSDYWKKVKLGSYTMHCTSLHMFINDWHALSLKHKEPKP